MKVTVARHVGRPLAADRKDAVLSVRMTDAQYATINADARAARESLSEYVLHRLISVYNNPDPVPTLLP